MKRIVKHCDSWTRRDEHLLRKIYPWLPIGVVAECFPDRTVNAIRSRAKILRTKKASGFGGRSPWCAREDRLLRRLYSHEQSKKLAVKLDRTLESVNGRARKLGLHKSLTYLSSPDACRLRRGDNVGSAHRFPKGHVPANKGIRWPGYAPGRMAETQFKRGQQPGNTMPLWSFRFNTDGYLLLKTGKPGKKPNDGWEWVHKLVWEQAHGPIRPGYRIWWKDGDHGNCSLANLELVSPREHMLRTTIHNLPSELREVIQLTGALKRKIRNREEKNVHGQEHVAGSAGSPVCHAGSAV